MNLISIIIPAKNEEQNIQTTLENISSEFRHGKIAHEILVINDGSIDNTENIVKKLAADHAEITLINNPGPFGIGQAIKLGLEAFQGNGVIIAMADASDNPKDMIRYVEALQQGYDCCFGSRWIPGGKANNYPFHKHLLNRCANHIIRFMFQLPYNDITNAFKAYSREIINKMKPLLAQQFDITVEMPLKAFFLDAKIQVIPIKWYRRKKGKTHLLLKEMGSGYVKTLMRMYKGRNRIKTRNPVG